MAAQVVTDDPNWQGRTSFRDLLLVTGLFTAYALPFVLAIAALVQLVPPGRVEGPIQAAGIGAALGLALYALLLGYWLGERFETVLELLPGVLGGGVAGLIAGRRSTRVTENG